MVDMEKTRMFCPNCHVILFPNFILIGGTNHVGVFRCHNCGYEKRISPNADTLLYHLK